VSEYPGAVELPGLPSVVTELGFRFAAAGHELALVGGSVRDRLLGRADADLDFATSARPEQTEATLRGWADAIWDVGRAFGTVGARRGGASVEITTYRTEVYDRESRKPVVAYGDTLDGDLARRDFTVNAMAVPLPGLAVVDPFGGLTDLDRRELRTPGRPEVSFDDDPLRMLRAARFVSTLLVAVDPDVRRAMTGMAERIGIVSAERVQAELVKLLLGADPVGGLRLLVNTGLAERVLPELPALSLTIDEHHRHKDVYEHSLTVVEQAIEMEDRLPGGGPDLVLRLAALLHDIGKPATRRNEPGGMVSFHHHDEVGARLARKRLTALRFPTAVVTAVSELIALHLRFHGYAEAGWTDSAVRRYVRDAGPQLARLHVLTRADCTTRNATKARRLRAAYDGLEARIDELAQREHLDNLRPDLDGTAIMALLGIGPGPVVGRAWAYLKELRIEGGPLPREDAELAVLRWWADQPESGERPTLDAGRPPSSSTDSTDS